VYTDHQNGIPDTSIGAAATKAADSIDSTQPSSVPSAIQAAQSASRTGMLDLLG
jgi:hypothetical protein